MKFDNTKKILVIGRAGLDIYPEPPGTKISDVNNFSSHLGGSAANTCVALSNLGVSTDLLTCISDDAIGEYIINKLNEFKVGVEHCRKVNKSFQTQIAVVETVLKNNQSILYRSNPCDLQLNKEDINKINFNNYSAVFISGTALSGEPSRNAVFVASKLTSDLKIPLIIDLDYRPYNWESDTIKSDVYKEIVNEMDIIIRYKWCRYANFCPRSCTNRPVNTAMVRYRETKFTIAKRLAHSRAVINTTVNPIER
mgnify:CR=1 FL=1